MYIPTWQHYNNCYFFLRNILTYKYCSLSVFLKCDFYIFSLLKKVIFFADKRVSHIPYGGGAEVYWRASETISLDFSKDKSALFSSKIKNVKGKEHHTNWHLKLLSEKSSFTIQLAEH